jgi:branched-chain amino acid transport system permease protein
MLSSGLTLIFSMMGVLNFAHASFYMVGAYFGLHAAGQHRLLGPALVLAPLVVGVLGAAFERYCAARVHPFGHVPELLVTFGLSYVVLEVVQLIWGRRPPCRSTPPCPKPCRAAVHHRQHRDPGRAGVTGAGDAAG